MQQQETDIYNQSDKELSELDPETQFLTLQSWFNADQEHSAPWRDQARMDFDFVAGDQWLPEDKAYLESEQRPAMTFNYVLSIIKSVCGSEVNGRLETAYLPRSESQTDAAVNEVLTAASSWMDDECDAQDEQSEAFEDCAVCGMGWTEAYPDYDEEPDGKYIETKVDPLEMYWDCAARKKNLSDATRLFRVRRIPIHKARHMFPGEYVGDLHADFVDNIEQPGVKPIEERRDKKGNVIHLDVKNTVTVVHAQWIELEPFYRVNFSDQVFDLSASEFATFKKDQAAAEVPSEYDFVKLNRKVYKSCFIGKKVLGKIKTNIAGTNFSFNCITGQRHRNKGTWFGLIAVMRDPQSWANKWISQILHILNTTAKGGVLAETDAFEDPRQAADTYARPDAITWVKSGALAQGKIMQKPGGGMVAGYFQMMEYAIKAIRDVGGVNMEILGMRDAQQPGVVEAHRKQAAMTILATLFDSFRRFKRRVGRVKLFYIQEYFSDGRIVRVADNDNNPKYMQLLKDKTLGRYDVVVDDAPSSPNQKEKNWFIIQQIMPAFKEMLTPEAVLLILEYSPLPTALINAFKEMAKSQQPSPEQLEAAELAKRAQMAAIGKDEAAAQKAVADAEKSRAMAESERLSAIIDMIGASLATRQQMQADAQSVLQPASNQNEQFESQFNPDDFVVPAMKSGLQMPAMPGQAGLNQGGGGIQSTPIQSTSEDPAAPLQGMTQEQLLNMLSKGLE